MSKIQSAVYILVLIGIILGLLVVSADNEAQFKTTLDEEIQRNKAQIEAVRFTCNQVKSYIDGKD